MLSIIISSYNRSKLFRRCLYSIVKNRPSVPFELVVADDASTEDTLGLINEFSTQFSYKFIRVNTKTWEKKTGLKRFFNNPSLAYNVAFKHIHPDSDRIFLMGNEIIAYKDAFNKLLKETENAHKEGKHYIGVTTTYDVPQFHLDKLDAYGSNLNQTIVDECERWPLQSKSYHSDVTNYLSVSPVRTWAKIGAFDERFLTGIACEDSDFIRRARAIPEGFETIRSNAISCHQFHGGKSRYYDPHPQLISIQKWDDGVAINRKIYDAWDGTFENRQGWPIGEYGVEAVITNSK